MTCCTHIALTSLLHSMVTSQTIFKIPRNLNTFWFHYLGLFNITVWMLLLLVMLPPFCTLFNRLETCSITCNQQWFSLFLLAISMIHLFASLKAQGERYTYIKFNFFLLVHNIKRDRIINWPCGNLN